jgi:hypothetical protein
MMKLVGGWSQVEQHVVRAHDQARQARQARRASFLAGVPYKSALDDVLSGKIAETYAISEIFA